jgi:hypothetical protein
MLGEERRKMRSVATLLSRPERLLVWKLEIGEHLIHPLHPKCVTLAERQSRRHLCSVPLGSYREFDIHAVSATSK